MSHIRNEKSSNDFFLANVFVFIDTCMSAYFSFGRSVRAGEKINSMASLLNAGDTLLFVCFVFRFHSRKTPKIEQ